MAEVVDAVEGHVGGEEGDMQRRRVDATQAEEGAEQLQKAVERGFQHGRDSSDEQRGGELEEEVGEREKRGTRGDSGGGMRE